jgi:2-amino-4-hydroxy-6-hydroxymethyldihydropteridine diphosphokinase
VSRAVLSLGSNLGDRVAHLRAAVAGFADVLVGVSPVYETAPWGGVDQDDFLNAVIVVDDPGADAWEWLRRGQALEDASGRVREVRWGPRTLDVDVVTVTGDDGPVESDHPDLLLPHPGHAGAGHGAAPLARRRPRRRAARPRSGRGAAGRARPGRGGRDAAGAPAVRATAVTGRQQ